MYIARKRCHGQVRVFHCAVGEPTHLWKPRSEWADNDTLPDWASMVVLLAGTGDIKYRVSAMYLEYENNPVGSPSPEIFDPTDPSSGLDYYEALSGTRDYLRVPLVSYQISASDEDLFPNGNRIQFFSQSDGSVGSRGTDFSDVANSVVLGGALVCTPDIGDRTKDLVVARFYLDTDQQALKLPSGEVGLAWQHTVT